MAASVLENELRLIVPVYDYVDMSTVPTLYLSQFNKKLSEQPGAKKLSKLFEEFPYAFRTMKTYSSNGVAFVYRVTQIPPNQFPVVNPKIPNLPPSKLVLPKTAPKPIPKSMIGAPVVPRVAPKQPGAKAVPTRVTLVELNDRSETAVSLSQLTTSFRSPQNIVPLGGLAAFICAEKVSARILQRDSLITCKKVGSAATSGSSILGFTEYDEDLPCVGDNAVFINTTEPFCAVCIGVQGAGKSHTMNVILENCMLNKVSTVKCSIVSSPQSMCGLVLHYDQSESNCCEAVGLNSPAAQLCLFPGLKVQRLVVLASPTYYLQRKAFYGDTCEVIPLLFDWDTLTATQLKKLMRLSDSDAQLYVSVILNKLREYQRKNKIPSFDGFLDEVMALCNVQGQNAPLQQVKNNVIINGLFIKCITIFFVYFFNSAWSC